MGTSNVANLQPVAMTTDRLKGILCGLKSTVSCRDEKDFGKGGGGEMVLETLGEQSRTALASPSTVLGCEFWWQCLVAVLLWTKEPSCCCVYRVPWSECLPLKVVQIKNHSLSRCPPTGVLQQFSGRCGPPCPSWVCIIPSGCHCAFISLHATSRERKRGGVVRRPQQSRTRGTFWAFLCIKLHLTRSLLRENQCTGAGKEEVSLVNLTGCNRNVRFSSTDIKRSFIKEFFSQFLLQ